MNLSSMENIFKKREFTRKRISTYDKTGANDDRIYIKPGTTQVVAEGEGPGVITHIWMTMQNEGFVIEPNYLRKTVLKMYWDDCNHPSVVAPIGDFFGMGHAMCKNFVSAPLQMSPEDGKGFNSWWPMPFKKNFKIEIQNDCNTDLILYFYIDYEVHAEADPDAMYFHALWNRELTKGRTREEMGTPNEWSHGGENIGGKENYLVADIEGEGHFCGCNVNIVNLDDSALWSWPGEGDDMIFIDGEKWPPQLHGTGTEDYVNMAWCPTQEYSAPYHGLILGGDENWKGKITYYRYHIQDPISFKKSIKVTIEHGHNNNRNDDWSTTAYWYQTTQHSAFAPIIPVEDRMPVDERHFYLTGEVRNVSNK